MNPLGGQLFSKKNHDISCKIHVIYPKLSNLRYWRMASYRVKLPHIDTGRNNKRGHHAILHFQET